MNWLLNSVAFSIEPRMNTKAVHHFEFQQFQSKKSPSTKGAQNRKQSLIHVQLSLRKEELKIIEVCCIDKFFLCSSRCLWPRNALYWSPGCAVLPVYWRRCSVWQRFILCCNFVRCADANCHEPLLLFQRVVFSSWFNLSTTSCLINVCIKTF